MAVDRTEHSLIADMAVCHAEAARKRMLESVGQLGARCESPIERVMAAALWARFNSADKWFTCHWHLGERLAPGPSETPFDDVFGFFQVPAGKYVVDIVLIVRWASIYQRIAIECDGHDFHERTKEQARHDRRRDRALQAAGFRVMRFTGSEIWANPGKCADEVMDVINALFEDR